jgi:FkbM family methyltransferase
MSFARSRGYDITPLWRLETRPLVLHLREVLDKYAIDCVLDVGANLGQFYDLLRTEIGWKGLVLSFEPVSKYADNLKLKILDYALGSVNGSATINVTKSPGLNSFLAPRIDQLRGFWKSDSILYTEVVQVRTLDSVFTELRRQHAFSSPYLKIDTQGFDLEVIRGASESLQEVRAMQTEASVKSIYEGQPSFIDSMEYLGRLGFEVTGTFPATRDDALRLIEFDCVMVNRRFAEALVHGPRKP